MTERSVILHLSEPPWAHPSDASEWRSQVFEPVIDGVLAAGLPTGLVLGGRLAEGLAEVDPVRFQKIREAVDGGQILLVATPLHNACLCSIPDRDAIGQLRAHITLLKRVFAHRARGCWLPYLSWDPSTPRILRKAGLEWTFLEEGWLRQVGAPTAPVLSVERDGHPVAVLRAGFHEHEGLILCQPQLPEEVPATLALLSQPRGPVEGCLQLTRARAYLPAGGPSGIRELQLLDDAGADILHKTMQRVSRSVRRLRKAVEATIHTVDGPDPLHLEQARRYLYRAQSGVAYGGEGCTTAIRGRAWRDLLRAETLAESELKLALPRCTVTDLDCDGRDEVRLRTTAWSATLAPASGGSLVELSHRAGAVNVLCGMLPLAFRETWNKTVPVATQWELVTTERPGGGVARAILAATGELEGVPVRITKGLQVGETGPVQLRLEVQNRGMDAARGCLSTELFLALGGRRWRDDPVDPVVVEVAGAKVPLDEVIELPLVEAIGLAGWRARIDLEMRPPASVHVEPLADGLARLELSWPVELFVHDREGREVKLHVREAPHG